MKTYHLSLMPNDASNCGHPRFSFPARISEPPKTLLVVDDEPLVRDMETQILRLQGYTVLEAENAAEALRLAARPPAIHLLITDFSMPEVDGLELTRRFREVHPKTPVLMVSGSLPLIRAQSRRSGRLATSWQSHSSSMNCSVRFARCWTPPLLSRYENRGVAD